MEAHDALPCTSGSAASVTTSERAQTTCATSSSAGTVTSTRGRLRNDLISVSSSSLATTTVGDVLAPALQQLDGLLRRRRVERVAGDEAERPRLGVVAQRGAQARRERPSCSP